MKSLSEIKQGDVVYRYLAGTIEIPLNVQSVQNGVIDCGWTFDQSTGAEIDDYLNWGPPPKRTGSYILAEKRGKG
jgi:hypothetical protein